MCRADACHARLRSVHNKHILVCNAPGVSYFLWSIHNRCMWWVIAKLEVSFLFCWTLLKRLVAGRPTAYQLHMTSLTRAGYNVHIEFDNDDNAIGLWAEVNSTQYEHARQLKRVCMSNGKHVRNSA